MPSTPRLDPADKPDSIRTASPPDAALLLTVRQTAAILQLGVRTIWRLARDGDLPAVSIGRCRRWRRSDVVDYVNRLRQS